MEATLAMEATSAMEETLAMEATSASSAETGFEGLAAGARVVVAMSGGVDSAVAAALTAAQGFEAVGVTLRLNAPGGVPAQRRACCAGQDVRDARRAARQLDMAHYVLDYERRFHGAVIDDFADSYASGRTPVPCVRCNERVKFGDLLRTARTLDAAALVTGHYVRRRPGPHGVEMHRAADLERDQSYFLFATTRPQLDLLRFPLGACAKAETRALARNMGLDVAGKPDSQDLCFVPAGGYARLVERLRPQAALPGDLMHVDGRILGRHRGIVHYTIGQRRGLGVSGGAPLYVVRIEAARRRVVVGPKSALAIRGVLLDDVNWLGPQPFAAVPRMGLEVRVKLRSQQTPQPATLHALPGACARVRLHHDAEGIAPGQACVFYSAANDSGQVLGGGWIRRTDDLTARGSGRSSSAG